MKVCALLICMMCVLLRPALAKDNDTAKDSGSVTVSLAGPAEIAIPDSVFTCSGGVYADVPDEPIRAFRDDTGFLHVNTSDFGDFAMTGPDFGHLKRPNCHHVFQSQLNPDPSKFADHQWLDATYTFDGKTVYALVHDEYEGWRYHPSTACPPPNYAVAHGKSCWYWAITSAVSHDRGLHYTPTQPDDFVAALPYRFSTDMHEAGIADPTNIIRNPHDGYFYVVVEAEHYQDQRTGRCLMRSKDLKTWRFWDGKAFDGTFVNPYRDQVDDPAKHACTPVYYGSIHSYTYDPKLDMFIAVGGNPTGGFTYTSSRDLIHWAPPVPLMPPGGGVYAALIDPLTSSRNFETIEHQPYLYYVQYTHTPLPSGLPGTRRRVMRVPVNFTLGSAPPG